MGQEIYTESSGIYSHNNPSWHEEDSPWKAKQIIKILEKNKIRFKTLAEIGCGAGEILNQLRLHYHDPDVRFEGFEISPDAFEMALKKQKPGLTFSNQDIQNKDARFDVLLMIDVIEHVENYIEFIKAYASKATYKILHVPLEMSVISVMRNKPVEALDSVGHLHFFTKDTILRILQDAKLEIVDYFYTAGGLELPNKPLRTKIMNIPRKLIYAINPDACVRLLGGYSLLILVK